MLRHCTTTTATGPMLPCRQDVAMMLKQEERHREKQSTIQRYEFHFTSIQRTNSITYFAVRKRTQHKLPQLKYYTRLGLLWFREEKSRQKIGSVVGNGSVPLQRKGTFFSPDCTSVMSLSTMSSSPSLVPPLSAAAVQSQISPSSFDWSTCILKLPFLSISFSVFHYIQFIYN